MRGNRESEGQSLALLLGPLNHGHGVDMTSHEVDRAVDRSVAENAPDLRLAPTRFATPNR